MWDELLDGHAPIWNAHTGGPLAFEYVQDIPCRCAGGEAQLCFRFSCSRCGAYGHRFTVFPGSRAAHERCDTCFDMDGAAVEHLDSWQEMAAEAEQIRGGQASEPIEG